MSAPDLIGLDKDLFLDALRHFRAVGLEARAAARAASLALRFHPDWSQAWHPPEIDDAAIPHPAKSVLCQRVGDSDHWETEVIDDQDVRGDLNRRFRDAAEAQFLADCLEETGAIPDDSKTQKRKAERARTHENTLTMARRLCEGGTEAFRASTESIWKVGIHSGEWEEITLFRRICFLPEIAAAVRADICQSLEFYLQKHTWCRMWVFTTGPRVRVGDVRARLVALHGKLSDLNRELKERYGWQIILRCSELGTPEEEEGDARRRREARARAAAPAVRTQAAEAAAYSPFALDYAPPVREVAVFGEDDAGSIVFEGKEPTYHPHSHVLVDGPKLSPERFSAMVSFVHEFMGEGHFKECGVIRKPREVCKYVTKECDLLRLDPRQLCDLEAALRRVHMVQPMGALREQRRRRKNPECPMKLVRKANADGHGFLWVERLDHNKKALKFKGDDDGAGAPMPADCCLLPAEGGHGLHCSVIARLRPAVGPAGVKEPRVLVRGNFKDVDGVKRHELTFKLWSETVEAYEAGLVIKAIGAGTWKPEQPFDPFTEDDPNASGEADAVNAHTITITGEQQKMEFDGETRGRRRIEPPPERFEDALPLPSPKSTL